jgi:hypothetical protein
LHYNHRSNWVGTGNRTHEQIDDAMTAASHDSLNRLVSHAAGGPLTFAGTLNESGTVTIAGQPAVIRLGMSEKEVEAHIGSPLNRVFDMHQKRWVHEYSRRPGVSSSYPMLWVTFTNGRVSHVYAKRHFRWVDSEEVYSLSAEHSAERTPQFESAFRR